MLSVDSASFWSRVDKTGDCWLWRGGTTPLGYGSAFGDVTHRIAWRLERGEIPEGMVVCHSCDNPPCVRPDHLWLGTSHENMQDCVRKGRASAVLTPDAARTIYLSALPSRTLAKIFDVTESTIKAVRNGVTWNSVTGGLVRSR